MIHGDLKGVRDHSISRFIAALTLAQSNVVVGADGHARIAGFRLARVIQNLDYTKRRRRPAVPKILDDKFTSMATDIFSFAMVMIEVRHE